MAKACAEETDGQYLDLESQRDLRKLSDPADYLSQREDKLVILDEIQRMPDFTVSAQLDLLENLLLLRKLQPWHANVGKRLVKSPKLYIRDSGLLHELLGIGDDEVLTGHPVVGVSWEGFVIENLLSCAPPRTEAYFYRTSAGAELDLILEFRSGEKWAIKIKRGLSPTLSRGFYSALEDVKPVKSFVVYGGDDRYRLNAKVEAIGLRLMQRELLDGEH